MKRPPLVRVELAITLSRYCVAAVDAGDHHASHHFMQTRDAVTSRFCAEEHELFMAWARGRVAIADWRPT